MSIRKVLRQERKFIISLDEYFRFSHRFSLFFKEDIHNEGNGYIVRSLYFDTLYDKDYDEKLDGIECRRKIRLRIYDTKSPTAFLEIKQKQGTNQLKRSLEISRKDAESVMKGNYRVLLNYKGSFAHECYAILSMNCYWPNVIVEYRRKAFVIPENDTRITFDSCIRSSKNTQNFFQRDIGFSPALHPSNVVLEIKFNHFLLAYVKRILQVNDRSETAVSKYVLARQATVKF